VYKLFPLVPVFEPPLVLFEVPAAEPVPELAEPALPAEPPPDPAPPPPAAATGIATISEAAMTTAFNRIICIGSPLS